MGLAQFTVQGQQALMRCFNTFMVDVVVPSWCAGDLDSALEGIRGLTWIQLVSDVRTLLNPTVSNKKVLTKTFLETVSG